MIIKKLTTDQKLDQIQEVLVDLVKLAGKTADDVSVLKQDVSILKQDVTVLKQDVSVLKKDVSILKSDISELKVDVSDLKDGQEYQGKKLDQIASFTHFTSGAFVA